MAKTRLISIFSRLSIISTLLLSTLTLPVVLVAPHSVAFAADWEGGDTGYTGDDPALDSSAGEEGEVDKEAEKVKEELEKLTLKEKVADAGLKPEASDAVEEGITKVSQSDASSAEGIDELKDLWNKLENGEELTPEELEKLNNGLFSDKDALGALTENDELSNTFRKINEYWKQKGSPDSDGDGIVDAIDNSSYNGVGYKSPYNNKFQVCEQFACNFFEGFEATCNQERGDQCWIVHGPSQSGGHATNLFKLDGQYYRVEPQAGSPASLINTERIDLGSLPARGAEATMGSNTIYGYYRDNWNGIFARGQTIDRVDLGLGDLNTKTAFDTLAQRNPVVDFNTFSGTRLDGNGNIDSSFTFGTGRPSGVTGGGGGILGGLLGGGGIQQALLSGLMMQMLQKNNQSAVNNSKTNSNNAKNQANNNSNKKNQNQDAKTKDQTAEKTSADDASTETTSKETSLAECKTVACRREKLAEARKKAVEARKMRTQSSSSLSQF